MTLEHEALRALDKYDCAACNAALGNNALPDMDSLGRMLIKSTDE